jgi:hypothetical protein
VGSKILVQFGTLVDPTAQRDLKLQKPNHPNQPLFLPSWISDLVLLLKKSIKDINQGKVIL